MANKDGKMARWLGGLGKKIFLSIFLSSHLYICLYSATIASQRIGCVDINRVIKEYPEAKKIKDDLSEDLKTRKEQIKMLQNQIPEDENKIKNMEEELGKYNKFMKEKQEKQASAVEQMAMADAGSTAAPADGMGSSTDTVVSSTDTVSPAVVPAEIQLSSPTFTQDDIDAQKTAVEKQKKDLEKYIKETEQAEKDINMKVKKNIFAKIYDAIKEISDKEGLTVVVDSYSIIYGEDAQDITEEVIKKLK